MHWLTRSLPARHATAHTVRLAAEELAPRDVPAVTWAVEGTTLHFTGTDGDDSVDVVRLSDGNLGLNLGLVPLELARTAGVTDIQFDGLAGDDAFVNETALPSVAYGGDGNDRLTGGSGRDVLRGGLGADSIRGMGGDDELHGGGGADELWGGDGNDTLSGGDGADALRGGAGDDSLSGDAGADTVYTGWDSDTITLDSLDVVLSEAPKPSEK